MSQMTLRLAISAGIAVSALAMLAGCAMSDDQAARFLVAPDKYTLYSCDEIARETLTKLAREAELQGLMAKAGTDSGGRLIGDIAYRPDYITVKGELNDLRQTAASKHCDGVPGAARASDGAVR
jgi:hypothetical protein